jgi:hypothetical protein
MNSSPIKLKTSGGPDGGKQKLSVQARRDKQARDKGSAMTKKRKDRKKENQANGQSSKYDLHHRPDGSVVKMSVKNNRNVWKHGERT